MNNRKFCLVVLILVIFIFCGICGFISIYDKCEDANNIDDTTAITIEGEISDVVIYGERATLYLKINEKDVALNLQEDTLIKNAKNQNCTYDNLIVGLMIEAAVDPNVWYDTREDVETGVQYEMSVYYKCYKILIK